MADVVRVISREQVRKGDTVIKQGDEGDKFYIVDAGEFEVRMTPRGPTMSEEHIEMSKVFGTPSSSLFCDDLGRQGFVSWAA